MVAQLNLMGPSSCTNKPVRQVAGREEVRLLSLSVCVWNVLPTVSLAGLIFIQPLNCFL